MTNAEKFKTASERRFAYEEYRRKSSNSIAGEFHWLELECKVELLPCPFCGGEAVLIEDKGIYNVFCSGCAATTNSAPKCEVAINLWNRRVK